MVEAKKSLGQHWLKNTAALKAICQAADLQMSDTVLEIGPGLGDLTRLLIKRAGKVIAVELDSNLAERLKKINAPNLEVVEADILKFDFSRLPPGYKIVANIPYYLTGHLFRTLTETSIPPAIAVLLVQKEVAQRIAAQPGNANIISVITQFIYDVSLGREVPAELFKPPPKVDSQVIVLCRREAPLFTDTDYMKLFLVVKAGFSGRRKKLRSSLAGGLRISKGLADDLLKRAKVNGDLRAQSLELRDWYNLSKSI